MLLVDDRARGSGIYLDIGSTAAFRDHDQLAALCKIPCQDGVCDPVALTSCGRRQGYDTVQFTHRNEYIFKYEILDTRETKTQTDGCPEPVAAARFTSGWGGVLPCVCVSKPALNCDGGRRNLSALGAAATASPAAQRSTARHLKSDDLAAGSGARRTRDGIRRQRPPSVGKSSSSCSAAEGGAWSLQSFAACNNLSSFGEGGRCVGECCCRCSDSAFAYNPAPELLQWHGFEYKTHVVRGAAAAKGNFTSAGNTRLVGVAIPSWKPPPPGGYPLVMYFMGQTGEASGQPAMLKDPGKCNDASTWPDSTVTLCLYVSHI